MARSYGIKFSRLSRRQVLGGIAVGTASLAVGGTGRESTTNLPLAARRKQ
jgi:hypothetical protein